MPDESLRDSELARFERNLENFAKLNPDEQMFHRFHGILESQIVTLQACGVLTNKSAIKLHQQVSEVLREKTGAER